jgi:hypothetical protein
VVVALAVGACKKGEKSEGAAGSAAGSAVVSAEGSAGSAAAIDAAAAEAPDGGGSAAGSGAGSAAAAAAETVSVDGKNVTMNFGGQQLKVSMTLPEGWILGEPKSNGFIFTPADAKYERPSIRVVTIGGVDPAPQDIAEAFAEAKKTVIGGGKLEVLSSGDRPDGKFLSIRVDAKKQRDIVYVETICWLGKADSKWTVRMNGFAEIKDQGLVKLFEEVCRSMQLAASP